MDDHFNTSGVFEISKFDILKFACIYKAKTKALISLAVTAKLICGFVFALAKSRFSHDAAQIIFFIINLLDNCNIEMPFYI